MELPLNSTYLFIFALCAYLVSAVSGLILAPRRILAGLHGKRLAELGISFVFIASAVASLANLIASTLVLTSRQDVVVSLFSTTPFGEMTFHIDPLSAFFLLVISLIGFA